MLFVFVFTCGLIVSVLCLILQTDAYTGKEKKHSKTFNRVTATSVSYSFSEAQYAGNCIHF